MSAIQPSKIEIQSVIDRIERRLKEDSFDQLVNKPLQAGYLEAIRLLKSGTTNYAEIEALREKRSQNVAILAVDYLRGECSSKDLTEIPLRVPFGNVRDTSAMFHIY